MKGYKVSMEQQGIQAIKGNEYANYKKSNVGKGALIGGITTTAISGCLVAYGYSTVGKELQALKNKSFAEKRKYLEQANKDTFFKGGKDSFYQCMKSGNKLTKNPLTWIGVAGIGSLIGALIGKLTD